MHIFTTDLVWICTAIFESGFATALLPSPAFGGRRAGDEGGLAALVAVGGRAKDQVEARDLAVR